MLVLTRQEHERIIIGDYIELQVLSIEDNRVQLGIEAPGSIEVHKKEIYESTKEENRQAAGTFSLGELAVFTIERQEEI